MRLVFAGTPEAAVPSVRALAASGHDVVGVVTRPDAPVGRKRILTPSPVGAAADALGLPVWKTARLDTDATDRIREWNPDIGVIVAYGGLVREPLLSHPPSGWINLHFSLLPRWRGAAPVQHALIAGDAETGVSVFQLVPELDAGDVFAMTSRPVADDDTAGSLLTTLADEGAAVLVSVVDAIASGTATAVPQVGTTTYAGKLDAPDGLLNWNEPATRVLARFRGTTPEPGAHTTVGGARLKILDARAAPEEERVPPGELRPSPGGVLVGTATDPVRLVRVQPAGRGAMAAADWWRGMRLDDAVAGS